MKRVLPPSEVSILEPLAQAALGSQDTKVEALYEIIAHAFGGLKADRVMIFSTFRGTLHYLADQLPGERIFAGANVWPHTR